MCCNKSLSLIIIVIILFVIFSCIIFYFCSNAVSNSNVLQAINSQVQLGNGSTAIIFDTNRIQRGDTISHDNNNSDINIVKPGIYLVNYSVTGSLETGNSPTFFELSLYQDNVLVPNSFLSSLVIPSGQSMSLSGSTIIEVNNVSNISLMANSASDIIYSDATVSIIELW